MKTTPTEKVGSEEALYGDNSTESCKEDNTKVKKDKSEFKENEVIKEKDLEKKKNKRLTVRFDTDNFVMGIRDSLFNLDLSHNRRAFSYKKGRLDFSRMEKELSSFYKLGKVRTEEALLRYGAYMCMNYAKETGLYNYYELYISSMHCPLGLSHSGSVHRDNLNISDLEGDKIFWIHCSENEIDDGLNNGLVSTSSLISTVEEMLGVDSGYAAYLCLSIGIMSSYELSKRFNYVLHTQCTKYMVDKIRGAFKSKKGDYKRWQFGNGIAIYNMYIADKKHRTKEAYEFLCEFKRKFQHDIKLGVIPKPDRELIKW